MLNSMRRGTPLEKDRILLPVEVPKPGTGESGKVRTVESPRGLCKLTGVANTIGHHRARVGPTLMVVLGAIAIVTASVAHASPQRRLQRLGTASCDSVGMKREAWDAMLCSISGRVADGHGERIGCSGASVERC